MPPRPRRSRSPLDRRQSGLMDAHWWNISMNRGGRQGKARARGIHRGSQRKSRPTLAISLCWAIRIRASTRSDQPALGVFSENWVTQGWSHILLDRWPISIVHIAGFLLCNIYLRPNANADAYLEVLFDELLRNQNTPYFSIARLELGAQWKSTCRCSLSHEWMAACCVWFARSQSVKTYTLGW